MSINYKPKLNDDGEVIGVIIDVTFSNPAPPSKSGKTLVDASTRGNIGMDLQDGKSYKLGLNIYHYPD